ncbi:uncharacterized protein E0L32_005981 [Thyridium curvatum]|uniref:Uncharacterized protein n=1 Tax=Thyridium curvatum TaxID=1093900 RepID=A0A507BA84_9PEZI|nr:uncharacterized protein E0L32_005981 [Thyridium curvatum]TPX13510.1 hypothetical protein E0L32_005981 [Thyridium curvatum]
MEAAHSCTPANYEEHWPLCATFYISKRGGERKKSISPTRMGEIRPRSGDKPPEEVNVVVSGGGPWGPGTPWPPVPVNSSWLIADALPRVVFRDGRPNIRVILYPDPLPSSWKAVRETVPRFWDGEKDFFRLYRDPDEPPQFSVTAVLHMGMLDKPREAFRLEKHGYKLGYQLPDVDGKYPDHDDLTGGGTWAGVPDRLSTDLDIDTIHRRVESDIEGANIVISHDHPRFICGYEYFNSLASLFNRQEKKRVLFMHTPIEHESRDIQHGVRIAVKVLESMVDDLDHQESYAE